MTVQHRRKQSVGFTGLDDLEPKPGEQRQVQVKKVLVDEYGFQYNMTPAQEEAFTRCNEKEQQRMVKWKKLDGTESEYKLQSEGKLKRRCRKGIPPFFRKWVWSEVSGANARREGHGVGYYAKAVNEGLCRSPFERQIQLDVPRTFPDNTWIQSEHGQEALRRVLSAFAHHNPRIGYCQGMNFVAAILLVVMEHDEEAAFWVLASLIDEQESGILYQDLYSSNLSGCHVEVRTLQELVASKLPRLASHLSDLKCDMSILATDWFLCLYCTTLPGKTAIRVWDALLLEGPKILFRIALALLKMHEPSLLATDNPGDVLRTIRMVSAGEFDRDELMKVAFDGIGPLSMERIQFYRARNKGRIDKEFAQRELRANLKDAIRNENYIPTEADLELLNGSPNNTTPNTDTITSESKNWREQLLVIGSSIHSKLPGSGLLIKKAEGTANQ